jgi:hypothetical protein
MSFPVESWGEDTNNNSLRYDNAVLEQRQLWATEFRKRAQEYLNQNKGVGKHQRFFDTITKSAWFGLPACVLEIYEPILLQSGPREQSLISIHANSSRYQEENRIFDRNLDELRDTPDLQKLVYKMFETVIRIWKD